MCFWLEVNQNLEVFIVELGMLYSLHTTAGLHGNAVRFHGKEGHHE